MILQLMMISAPASQSEAIDPPVRDYFQLHSQ